MSIYAFMNVALQADIEVPPRLQRLNERLAGTFLAVYPSSVAGNYLGLFLNRSPFPLSRAVYSEDPLFYWELPGRCAHCLGPVDPALSSCCEMRFCSRACFTGQFNKHSLVCSCRTFTAGSSGVYATQSRFYQAAERVLNRKRGTCARGMLDALFFVLNNVARELPEAKNELRAIVNALLPLGEICPARLGESQLGAEETSRLTSVFADLRGIVQLLQPDFNCTGDFRVTRQMLFNRNALDWLWNLIQQVKIPIKHAGITVGYGVYNVSSIINYSQQATARFAFSAARITLYSVIEDGELFIRSLDSDSDGAGSPVERLQE